MELEGREVAVAAQVECEPPPDTRCRVTCQQHQVQPSVPGWAVVPWLPASAGAHTQPSPGGSDPVTPGSLGTPSLTSDPVSQGLLDPRGVLVALTSDSVIPWSPLHPNSDPWLWVPTRSHFGPFSDVESRTTHPSSSQQRLCPSPSPRPHLLPPSPALTPDPPVPAAQLRGSAARAPGGAVSAPSGPPARGQRQRAAP